MLRNPAVWYCKYPAYGVGGKGKEASWGTLENWNKNPSDIWEPSRIHFLFQSYANKGKLPLLHLLFSLSFIYNLNFSHLPMHFVLLLFLFLLPQTNILRTELIHCHHAVNSSRAHPSWSNNQEPCSLYRRAGESSSDQTAKGFVPWKTLSLSLTPAHRAAEKETSDDSRLHAGGWAGQSHGVCFTSLFTCPRKRHPWQINPWCAMLSITGQSEATTAEVINN